MRAPECSKDVHLDEVASFLSSCFPSVEVKVGRSPFKGIGKSKLEQTARFLASSRIKDVARPFEPFEPMYGEVDYELRGLLGEARVGGIVYDGRRLEEVLIQLLGARGGLQNAVVVVTDRLVSTYSRDDLRQHLRTVMLGFPSILSVPGLVEAPARPREFYVLKQRLESSAGGIVDQELVKEAFRGRFIDYGSPAMTEVSKGLALQAVFHHMTLSGFCPDKHCRLFNAHWQEDLLRSQNGNPGLCSKHSRLLNRLCKDPTLTW